MTNIYDEIGRSAKKYNRQINQLLEPLKAFLGIDRIWRNEHKNGGIYSVLGNHPPSAEIFFEEKLYVGHPYFRNPRFFQTGFAVPELYHSPEYEETQGVLTKEGDCFHVLLAIRKNEEGFVEYGFASSKFRPGFEMGYLNHLHSINSFIDYFEKQASKYILEASDGSINIAELVGASYNEHPHFCGPTVLPVHELQFLTAVETEPCKRDALLTLTKAEKEVLRFYLQGLSMPEIAKKRYRSTRTIEHHIENIKAKLGINSRSGLFDFLLPYRDVL